MADSCDNLEAQLRESFCYAEVNLANYAHNLAQIKAHLPKSAKILAVIKAPMVAASQRLQKARVNAECMRLA